MPGQFKFTPSAIPDVLLIEPRCFGDERGYFFEAFRQEDFLAAGMSRPFVQDNLSRSSKGVLRGLHYQLQPKSQGKLMRCARGAIFDVAVDLRKNSPHFGKWVGYELNDREHKMLYIPPGFAHGFYTLSDIADVMYKQTDYYSPEHERGIIWNDPDLAVRWPMSDSPLLSPKDARYPRFTEAERNF